MLRRRLPAALLTAATVGAITMGASTQAIAAAPAAVTTASTTSSVMMPAGGPFSAGTAWRLDVRKAPVNARSAAMVKNVAAQTARQYSGLAAFNVTKYNTAVYTVTSTQKRVDVKWDNCQGKSGTPKNLLGAGGQFSQVPIPASAVPAGGSDGQMTIYSPATHQLWEFWKAKKVNGTWSACWGGRIDNLPRSQGYFANGFGASASGLAVTGGTVGIAEVQKGSIDHAIALSIPKIGTSREISYPAQRSDGWDTSAGRIPTGTRLRLDPSINVDSLDLHPIARMVAKAAQKYGFIVTDAGGCTAISAESPAGAIAATGSDPWKPLLNGTASYAVLENFPWSRLQALPKDYGKP